MGATAKTIYPNRVPFAQLQNHLDAPVPPAPPGPAIREVFVGVMGAGGEPQHTQVEANHPVMPHVDTAQGNTIVGTDHYPKEFPTDPFPLDEPGLTSDVEHTQVGKHDRAAYLRNYARPAGATTAIRTWGAQASAEVYHGVAADFDCGHPGDLTGLEGAAIHWGTGLVKSVVSLITAITNRRGGRMAEAVGYYLLFPMNAYPTGGIIDRAVGVYLRHRTEGFSEPLTKFAILTDKLCGAVGLGFLNPVAQLAVNGGIHAGGESDPGDGKIQGAFVSSDGSVGVSGTFLSADVPPKTVTVKDGVIVGIV